MLQNHLPENTKLCPGCGTCLMNTARHCSMCGYVFLETANEPVKKPQTPGMPRITLSLPGLLALVLALLVMNTVVILGWQRREVTRVEVKAVNATSTYMATTYVSPTPSPTETRTPAPPTETPVPEILYTVVSGDSCLSIVTRFQVSLDALARENDELNCDLLSIGTVLTIPQPTPTPEPTVTPPEAPAPGSS